MNLFERTAFDLFQRASGNSAGGGGGGGEGGPLQGEHFTSTKSARDIFPRSRLFFSLKLFNSSTKVILKHINMLCFYYFL